MCTRSTTTGTGTTSASCSAPASCSAEALPVGEDERSSRLSSSVSQARFGDRGERRFRPKTVARVARVESIDRVVPERISYEIGTNATGYVDIERAVTIGGVAKVGIQLVSAHAR